MKALQKRRLSIVAITLLSTMMGTGGGVSVGRTLMLRSVRLNLDDYAQALVSHADDLKRELDEVFRLSETSPYPFCSDKEITALQAETFRAEGLKDIGRTRDGKLYCSAFLGRLKKPYVEGHPTLTQGDGWHVWTNVPVVIDTFEGKSATVVEKGSADVVLNPNAFGH